MKVGTDGVLLGAWAGTGEPKRILDIGTGTGLIALILAQRFPQAEITAIEPNALAYDEAAQNFAASPFFDRINLDKKKIQDFTPSVSYDLIVSNPPFFTASLINEQEGKAQARHSLYLTPQDLSKGTDYLRDSGEFGVIYPPKEASIFTELMVNKGFDLIYAAFIRPNLSKPIHRKIQLFSKSKKQLKTEEIVIEEGGRHQFSQRYRELTEPYYLDRHFQR